MAEPLKIALGIGLFVGVVLMVLLAVSIACVPLLMFDSPYGYWGRWLQLFRSGKASRRVREALARAVEVIIDNVPPCPDRTVAIRKIREAGINANSAITHEGKF